MAQRSVRAVRRSDGLVEFLDQVDLPTGKPFTVTVEVSLAPSGTFPSLRGIFREAHLPTDEDFAEAKRLVELGAEKQAALLATAKKGP